MTWKRNVSADSWEAQEVQAVMFLNEHEIDDAAEMLADGPLMGPASKYLKAYKDLINENSDGWPHWSTGTRVASDLCTIVHDATLARRGFRTHLETPTLLKTRKAITRIKNFIARNKHLKSVGVTAPEDTLPLR